MRPSQSHLAPSALLALALSVACGPKAEFEGANQIGTQAKTQSGIASTENFLPSETGSDNTFAQAAVTGDPSIRPRAEAAAPHELTNNEAKSETEAEPNAVAEANSVLDSVAMPPVAVSGAYLSCILAAQKDSIACFVKDESGKTMTVPSEKQLGWTVVQSNGVSRTVNPLVKQTESAGTIFYVPLSGAQAGTVNFVIDGSQMSFEVAPLFRSDADIVRFATPLTTVPPTMFKRDLIQRGEMQILGDGNLAVENDKCLGTTQSITPVNGIEFTVTPNKDLLKTSAYLDRICGLQNSATYITITGPAPFKPIKSFLLPEATSMLLFSNMDLPAGTFKFTIGSTSKLPNGTLDDFSLGSIQINPSDPSNLNVEFDHSTF